MSCTGLALKDGIVPVKRQDTTSPNDLLLSQHSPLYDDIISEQDSLSAKWHKNVITQQQMVDKVSYCIRMMAKNGIKRSLSECELHIKSAVKHCKKQLKKENAGEMGNICRDMLRAVSIESATYHIQQEREAPICNGTACTMATKKAKTNTCTGPASCNAGELCGYQPGKKDKICITDYKALRSATQQLKVQYFKDVATSAATSQTQGDVLVRVYTLPIGQGDCNIIKCNEGKNVIVFDCGSSSQSKSVFASNKKLLQSFFKKVDSVTILVSHGDQDHYNLIETILEAKAISKYVKTILVGGKSSQYSWERKNVQVFSGSSVTKDFCGSSDITFEIFYAGKGYVKKNQMGIMMKLSCTNCLSQLLFSGDMEGDAADNLAKNHGQLLKSTHYKMAHHGASSYANHEDWLKAISPVEVHVSHEYIFRRYFHPRCDAFNRLTDIYSLGMASDVKPLAMTHDITCFFNDGTSHDQSVYHRVYNTAPRADKRCLIVMSFKYGQEATTEYICDDPDEFKKISIV